MVRDMEPDRGEPNDSQRNDLTSTQNGPATNRTSRKYWESVSGDTSGMLGGVPTVGGFSSIPRIDIQGSRTFLARLGIGVKSGRKPVMKAIDGGAGIGRVTKDLLLPIAESVDVIEPVSKFTDGLDTVEGVDNIYNVGLEDWEPAADVEYDLMWTQWCLGYLTDQEVVHYLEICKTRLRHDTGLIVIKENLSSGNEDMLDETDGSVTRRDETFRDLFKQAGLRLIRTDIQRGFPEIPPKRLLPVRMYALKP